MDKSNLKPLSPEILSSQLGTGSMPLLLDVRKAPAFEADDWMIIGSLRRDPEQVAKWCKLLPTDRTIVVYCVHGHEVSQGVAAALQAAGFSAAYLEGGIADWAEHHLPRRRKRGASPSTWVTRERPKIDRIACPWLIRRFIEPEAQFLYAPTERVFAVAAETGAIPYDIPGAEPFSHEGDLCSFDGFLKTYGIADPALDRMALIVRGADTGRPDLTAQSAGLLAISLGLSANFPDDQALLDQGMILYDALYAWCRNLQAETHSWSPAA